MSFSVDEYMLLTKRTNDSHLLSYLAGEDQSSVLSRSEMDALGQRRRDRLKDISDTLVSRHFLRFLPASTDQTWRGLLFLITWASPTDF